MHRARQRQQCPGSEEYTSRVNLLIQRCRRCCGTATPICATQHKYRWTPPSTFGRHPSRKALPGQHVLSPDCILHPCPVSAVPDLEGIDSSSQLPGLLDGKVHDSLHPRERRLFPNGTPGPMDVDALLLQSGASGFTAELQVLTMRASAPVRFLMPPLLACMTIASLVQFLFYSSFVEDHHYQPSHSLWLYRSCCGSTTRPWTWTCPQTMKMHSQSQKR